MLNQSGIRDGFPDGTKMGLDPLNANSSFSGFASNPTLQSQPSTPNFLFGSANRRRSLAIPPTHSYSGGGGSDWGWRDDSNVYPSAIPAHITPSSMNKSVHWSPSLVRVQSVSPRPSAVSVETPRSSSTPFSAGPPLRSIRDELTMRSNDSSAIAPSSGVASSPLVSTEQENENGQHWVTVFGFAPEDAARVMQLFSRHGTIVAHRLAERGNWVYLRYASAIHAQQALSRNGRIVEGRLRLGVIPTDREELASVMDMEVDEPVDEPVVDRPSLSSPARPVFGERGVRPMVSATQSPSFRLTPSSAKRTTMRSLSAAYNTADNQFNVNGTRQPLKEQGFLDKIYSYLP